MSQLTRQQLQSADLSKQIFEEEYYDNSESFTAVTEKNHGKLTARFSADRGIGSYLTSQDRVINVTLAGNIQKNQWHSYEIIIADSAEEDISHLIGKRVFITPTLTYRGFRDNQHQYFFEASVSEFQKAELEVKKRPLDIKQSPAAYQAKNYTEAEAKADTGVAGWLLVGIVALVATGYALGGAA